MPTPTKTYKLYIERVVREYAEDEVDIPIDVDPAEFILNDRRFDPDNDLHWHDLGVEHQEPELTPVEDEEKEDGEEDEPSNEETE